MNISNVFFRTILALLSILFFTLFAITTPPYGFTGLGVTIGIASGLVFSLILLGSEYLFRQVSLKSLNTTTLGLFFGFLLGQATLLIFSGVLNAASLTLWPETMSLINAGILLFCVYFGVTFTVRAAEEVYVSLPFIKLKPTIQKSKDLILDNSILGDSRIIDLASSGLLDNRTILPRFILKEIYDQAESHNESVKAKARRALEVVKKLESIANLDLRIVETDFPEIKETSGKLVRLARIMNANIFTADMSLIEQSSVEGVCIINIHSLSKALKPLTHSGEFINIKVQRYGKEARQGVGYLDDGTMVVINGGAEYIGEVIKAQVLSVKHTSSGRMIFCNSMDEMTPHTQEMEESLSSMESPPKNYFAL
ncbi:MAG: PIN/TRAM domain-containing protein [Waddliaceae bacterium]